MAGYCRCQSDADCEQKSYQKCMDPRPNTPGKGKVCRPKHPGQIAGLFVYRDVSDAWVSSRPIWNQHAYYVTNVDDHGVDLPVGQAQKNWQVQGLNNFRQNVVGTLEPTKAPNLTVRIGVLGNCDAQGRLAVPVYVCNRGEAPVASGVNMVLMDDSSGAQLCLKHTIKDLFPGDCEEFTCVVWPPEGGSLDLKSVTDFGGMKGDVTECNEQNNQALTAAVTCQKI